jgi:hypothetical protein
MAPIRPLLKLLSNLPGRLAITNLFSKVQKRKEVVRKLLQTFVQLYLKTNQKTLDFQGAKNKTQDERIRMG